MAAHGHHGHGDHALEERERTLKTYMLSLTVWVCVLGAGFWIYEAGSAQHAKAPTRRGATMHRGHARKPIIHRSQRKRIHDRRRRMRRRTKGRTGRPAMNTPAGKRYAEARRWMLRMRKNGHSLRVYTSGSVHNVLHVLYPSEPGSTKMRAKQREHIAKLKEATPWYRHLRGLGFERLNVRVGHRMAFSRNL